MKLAPTDSVEYQTHNTKKNQKYNFGIALAQGILIRISFAFTDPTTVLAAFIYKLTQNNFLVGVTGSLMTTGWMWPQFLVSNLIEHRPRKLPFYILGMSCRVFCWVVICLGTFFISTQNYLLLATVFLVFYFLAASSMGVSTIPYMDIISKSIRPERRARFFSLRQLVGRAFEALIGVFFVTYMLFDPENGAPFWLEYAKKFGFGPSWENSRLAFPYNYAVLFFCTTVSATAAFAVFANIREPIHPVKNERQPIWNQLKQGLHIFKTDIHYRRFIWFRISGHFSGIAAPFYAPYAIQKLSVPELTVGYFLAVGALAGIVSNVFWGYIGEKYGTRLILVITSGLFCLPSFVALSSIALPKDLQLSYYYLVFAVGGITTNGVMVGFMTYMLNISPELSRPTYIGFMNTVLVLVSFVPAIGGLLVPFIGYKGLFMISIVSSGIALLMACRLEEIIRSDHENNFG